MHDLTGHAAELRRLTRTDPDPRVRHRADALLVLAHGRTVEEAAHDMGCCPKRIRVWRRRFLAEGRTGWPIGRGRDDRRCCRAAAGRCWSAPWRLLRWTTAIR